MLHRLIVSLFLLLLFALMQIGVITHEISHSIETKQQNQHDPHTVPDHCAQCLAYAQSAAGTLLQQLGLADISLEFHFAYQHTPQLPSLIVETYRARAPPPYLV